MWNLENDTDEPISKSGMRCICRKWICGHGEREGGMNWEIRIDICTLPCGKQIVGTYYKAQ